MVSWRGVISVSYTHLYSGAKPGKAVHVQGAGFQCGGHLGGMLLVIAVHAAAAHYKGRDLHLSLIHI